MMGSFLSLREHQIIRLVKRGESYSRIAEDLDISKGTVGMYLHRAKVKLGVRRV